MQCAFALALVLGVAACGDDSATDSANGASAGTYDPSRDGLARLGADLFAAITEGDDERAAAIAEGLALPDADAWFTTHFGAKRGPELAKAYAPKARGLAQLVSLFTELARNGQTDIAVERFERAGDDASTGYQSIALETMKQKTPLYSMRIRKVGADDVFHLWSFVYADGFRWIGKLESLSGAEPATPDLLEYRLRDAERAAKAHAAGREGGDGTGD